MTYSFKITIKDKVMRKAAEEAAFSEPLTYLTVKSALGIN